MVSNSYPPLPLKALLIALIVMGLLDVLVAPLLAWIYINRKGLPATRRAIIVVTLAFDCVGLYFLFEGTGLWIMMMDIALAVILCMGGGIIAAGFFALPLLAYGRQPRDGPVPNGREAGGRRE